MIAFASNAVDCLTISERAALRKLSKTRPHVRATLRQLLHVSQSRAFARVHPTTRGFLDFIVSKTLIGQAEGIKEMTVALRVFHESIEFNPLESSKVRVAALALRRRLAAYYADEGASDPIQITIPIGTYIPRLHFRKQLARWRRDETRTHQWRLTL